MTILTTFLPILIMIGLVGVCFFVIKKSFNFKRKKRGFGTNRFLVGYILVLLIATILFYVLPDDEFLSVPKNPLGWSELEQIQNNIYQADDQEAIDQMEELDVVNEWSIPFQKDELIISSTNNGEYIFILAEVKSEMDNTIEVVHYATNSMLLKRNDQIAYDVELENNTLNIMSPNPVNLKLQHFDAEFTTTQFSKTAQFKTEYFSFGIRGPELLYIKVPNNVKITGDVEFVEK
ncbi:hypothetical protein [Aquibacillus rhizosphaerae]|uniref:DUF4352 domain-containing protein n=1 Tax=Aquibacillus rhizosphaerae TaxID=3051431 RepID=A0ABT7LC66_9BACI|nr:hypothetical protein [Aquibacillus sp. LR5S19]MDL4842780.1 hypothetical protein [Aquibacillus sp. LR5S19]